MSSPEVCGPARGLTFAFSGARLKARPLERVLGRALRALPELQENCLRHLGHRANTCKPLFPERLTFPKLPSAGRNSRIPVSCRALLGRNIVDGAAAKADGDN